METFYDVLGIGPDADPQSLKAAYRREAHKWHPDKNNGSTESHERFKQITEAYGTLSNPDARRVYDAALTELAIDIFLQEMVKLALELTFQQRLSRRDVVARLVAQGCPEPAAGAIAKEAARRRASIVRQAMGWQFFISMLLFSLGIGVTAISYFGTQPGGRYLIAIGLMSCGVAGALRSLFHLLTGQIPTPK